MKSTRLPSGKYLARNSSKAFMAGIVLPLRIGGILQIVGRDDALRILEAGRLDHAADRGRDVVEEVQRVPSDFGDFLDRLRGEFRRGDVEEDVGAEAFNVTMWESMVRFGGLVTILGDDHRGGLGAEAVFQALT